MSTPTGCCLLVPAQIQDLEFQDWCVCLQVKPELFSAPAVVPAILDAIRLYYTAAPEVALPACIPEVSSSEAKFAAVQPLVDR